MENAYVCRYFNCKCQKKHRCVLSGRDPSKTVEIHAFPAFQGRPAVSKKHRILRLFKILENEWENVYFPFPQLMPALQVSEVVQLGKPEFPEILFKNVGNPCISYSPGLLEPHPG